MFVDKNIKILVFVMLVFIICIKHPPATAVGNLIKGGYDNVTTSILEKTSFLPSRTF